MIQSTYVSLTSPLLAIFFAPALVEVFIVLVKDLLIYLDRSTYFHSLSLCFNPLYRMLPQQLS